MNHLVLQCSATKNNKTSLLILLLFSGVSNERQGQALKDDGRDPQWDQGKKLSDFYGYNHNLVPNYPDQVTGNPKESFLDEYFTTFHASSDTLGR